MPEVGLCSKSWGLAPYLAGEMAIGSPQPMRDEANRKPVVVETRRRTQDAAREMRAPLVRRGWLPRGWPPRGWLLVIRPRQGEQRKGSAPFGSRPFPLICIALAHSLLRARRFPTARAQSSRHRPRRVRPSTAHSRRGRRTGSQPPRDSRHSQTHLRRRITHQPPR